MATQDNIELLNQFDELLPNFDISTAYLVHDRISTRITELKQELIEEVDRFKAEVAAKSKELGLTVTDLFPPEQKVKAPPKYQDPNDPTKTWSGKGKVPNWIKAALDSGKTLDDLLIPTTDVDPDVGF